MTELDLKEAKSRSAFTAAQGKIWIERKRDELDALPKGTVVIIDIVTGEYVTGKSWLEGHPRFVERFGSSAQGYVYRVGERTFIGGGIA